MSIENHLEIILGKAQAAKERTDAALILVNRIQTLEAENRLTPQMETELEPYLETVGAATVPNQTEYASLDAALEAAENICKSAE